LAAPGCHVYLWATNKTLASAFDVLEAWGCRFHLCMPLVKKSGIVPCNGYVFGSEFCLLGFAGRPMLPFLTMGKLNWLTVNPVPGQHSAKPDAFYELVEEMSPGPRLDCFARKPRTGYDVWGDAIPGMFQEAL
jgi:N6-adenosine-specific RNA methylase IME4